MRSAAIEGQRSMPEATDKKQPARVPGDAEAPPNAEEDRTAGHAVSHSDKTEATQSAKSDRKPA